MTGEREKNTEFRPEVNQIARYRNNLWSCDIDIPICGKLGLNSVKPTLFKGLCQIIVCKLEHVQIILNSRDFEFNRWETNWKNIRNNKRVTERRKIEYIDKNRNRNENE